MITNNPFKVGDIVKVLPYEKGEKERLLRNAGKKFKRDKDELTSLNQAYFDYSYEDIKDIDFTVTDVDENEIDVEPIAPSTLDIKPYFFSIAFWRFQSKEDSKRDDFTESKESLITIADGGIRIINPKALDQLKDILYRREKIQSYIESLELVEGIVLDFKESSGRAITIGSDIDKLKKNSLSYGLSKLSEESILDVPVFFEYVKSGVISLYKNDLARVEKELLDFGILVGEPVKPEPVKTTEENDDDVPF